MTWIAGVIGVTALVLGIGHRFFSQMERVGYQAMSRQYAMDCCILRLIKARDTISNMRVPYMDIEAQYMDAPHRRVVDLRRDGLADVPMLGMYSYSRARPDLPVHRHAGGWEICYLERGNQVFEVCDQTYQLRGGDVFLTFPDEPHSTGGSPSEPGVLYWLNVRRPAEGRTLLGWPRAESQMLLASLWTPCPIAIFARHSTRSRCSRNCSGGMTVP